MNHHNEERGRVREVDIRTLGIDLAKNLFRVHGVDAKGKMIVAAPTSTAAVVAVHGAALTLSGGHGSLRWSALLGARDREAWDTK